MERAQPTGRPKICARRAAQVSTVRYRDSVLAGARRPRSRRHRP